MKIVKNKKYKEKKIFSKKSNDFLLESDENSRGLNLNLSIDVDKRQFLDSEVNKVEVIISTKELNEIKKTSFKKDLNKNFPKHVNSRIINIGKFRKQAAKELFDSQTKLTEMSVNKIINNEKSSKEKLKNKSDAEIFGTKSKIIIEKSKTRNSNNIGLVDSKKTANVSRNSIMKKLKAWVTYPSV